MRWPIAIAIGFAILFLWNAVFITIAITGADPVSPDYLDEANRR
jgi:hypothetical protein